jgi:peptidoglycan L-alanyl-D-glutamate endopeptidase CwlK
MPYVLGQKSLRELEGVHPRLVACVKRAIQLTPVDFGVHDGLRTREEQARYLKAGVSKTMNSKHLRQADGWGHAVDLVPYINGKLRWEWPPIFAIAASMAIAARELQLPLRWGGVWDRRFPVDFPTYTAGGMERAVSAYTARQRERGRRAFLDGPHFELA